jgi:hypothetical protein
MTDDNLIMWSIGKIAERDNVSKPAISKSVKKLIEARPDTPVSLDGQGRVLAVSLAHYDEYRQRFVNPAKATAPIRSVETLSAPPLAPTDSFDEARRVGEWLKVGREKIRHQEQLGQLLRADMVDEAVRAAGAEIKTVVSRLANRADDLALAVSKEGVHGVRVALRRIAFELGNEIADKLEQISAGAAADDAMIDSEEV